MYVNVSRNTEKRSYANKFSCADVVVRGRPWQDRFDIVAKGEDYQKDGNVNLSVQMNLSVREAEELIAKLRSKLEAFKYRDITVSSNKAPSLEINNVDFGAILPADKPYAMGKVNY